MYVYKPSCGLYESANITHVHGHIRWNVYSHVQVILPV